MMKLGLPSIATLAFVAEGRLFSRDDSSAVRKAIRMAVPWVERLHGLMFRAFLESPLTVHDMMHKLGKRRPDDIYRMIFVITKTARRHGYLMDKIQKVTDTLIDVSYEPIGSLFDARILLTICDKFDGLNTQPLTEKEEEAICHLLENPKLPWPSPWVLERHRLGEPI